MKRRLIVLLAGLAYIMPAAAQQTLFDRYAEKQGVTYVNINGESIKDEKYKQLIKTVDSDEKVCILKKEKSSDCPSAFLITVQSKEDTQLIWITGDMRKEDLEKLLKKL